MAIPELNQFSEKAQEIAKKMMFEYFWLTWPTLVKKARASMREDLKTAGSLSPATYHPNLAGLFNYYLNEKVLNSDSEILNEIWRVLFSKEYNRMQMRKLEKEIDMSDVQTVSYSAVRNMFKDYGYIVCLEKTGTLRLQPWEITAEPNPTRYYVRASQAKAIFKVRMLDKWQISLEDASKALEIVKEKNPYKADCLKVDLTNC